MIPKIIHYCWFGGNPIPVSYQCYIDSWRRPMGRKKIRCKRHTFHCGSLRKEKICLCE